MEIGMSLRLSPALTLRHALESRLEQSLFIRQTQRLELRLYLKREEELTKLYRKALERRQVKLYDKHGMKFEFALVPAKDVPQECKACGHAFSHCLYNALEAFLFGTRYALSRGSWLLFVVYDMYPTAKPSYLEYAAVHERGEQVTLGDHNLASKLEFAIAREEGKLLEYMDWLEESCPAKFADIFSYQTHLELPAADEFQEVLELSASTEEAAKVKALIEDFEWPMRILQKLEHYRKRGDDAVAIVTAAVREAGQLLESRVAPLRELIAGIEARLAAGLRGIIEQELEKYLSLPRLDALWREYRAELDRKFGELLYRRQLVNPRHVEEVAALNIITGGLPGGGVLSFKFSEAFNAARDAS